MIELLLAADRLLAAGDLDRAERIFRQVIEADPRNAIAVVGLARVAEAKGGHDEAVALAHQALDIDPEDLAAQRLVEPEPPAPIDLVPPATEAPGVDPSRPNIDGPGIGRPSIWARITRFFRGGH